ncbi:MAG TPA: Trm112 family protein [Desulfovibrio sp.]|uniref:Trm112 family protein n=1 Tax=Desulfovibrio sp. TaxID=885 RepID=UPI002D478988|nr:Trm112 family protein [Desulfovibrio sp.]HZF61812.1 Trm112 family protein [Desulfovibrio sp.]
MPMETRELLQILACPKCLGNLVALEDNGSVAAFACKACGVVYPVRDNIPIMLVEEAIPLEDWNKEHPAAKECA